MSEPLTKTMGIIHSALRRDLARTRQVLSSEPFPQQKQRQAIADHLLWMMQFLHRHHSGEDAGLWPAVRAKNPAAAGLLDRMDADHKSIGPGIEALESAAQGYRTSELARQSVLAAIDLLESNLLPHLQREELEMMPIVGQTLTQEELDNIENTYFIDGKSKSDLADEGHWIIDNTDPESRQLILGIVGPVLWFVLVYAFGPRYRRKRNAMWGNGPAADIPSLKVVRI
ncbi:MAG: hemerythrin domain-containing protein [Nocardiaceae bacterium]|nr:hemerythrin domain-containing protein [Nocardiaceae bacterium]